MGAHMTRDEKIDAMLDKHEITELLYAYCNAADRHDHEKMRSLYHEDATDDHGSFFKGPAMEFIDMLPEIQAPMEILHHNITSINIALNGDKAEGEVYMIAFHRYKDEDGQSVDLLVGGRYFDKYEKRDGIWKYSERAVVADWASVNDPSTVRLDHPLVEGSHIGRPGREDPSYSFFSLLQWGKR